MSQAAQLLAMIVNFQPHELFACDERMSARLMLIMPSAPAAEPRNIGEDASMLTEESLPDTCRGTADVGPTRIKEDDSVKHALPLFPRP